MNTKKPNILVILCCLVYFASYVTRLDYAAVLVEIVKDLQIPKTTASIAVTGSFVTYGLGMIVFGLAADRIQPRILIAVGLLGTSLINFAMGVLPNIDVMIVIWCFNGFFQAMLWPPLTRILSENLGAEAATNAIASVTLTAQVATLGVYLLSPLVIRSAGWRTVFVIASAVGFAVVALWLPGTAKVRQFSPHKTVGRQGVEPIGKLVRASGLVPVMGAIVLMGMLRDGLQTWMPTYICEVFGFRTASSIGTSALLPFLSFVSISVSMALFQRVRNEMLAGAILFGVGFAAAAVMVLTYPGSAMIGIILFSLIAGCMHGVNQMIACSTPPHFERYGRVATFSGLLNSFVYVGAATSTYGFAGIAERFGWRMTMVIWMVLALVGTIICAACVHRWKTFCTANDA